MLQGRHLRSQVDPHCNTYVQVCIVILFNYLSKGFFSFNSVTYVFGLGLRRVGRRDHWAVQIPCCDKQSQRRGSFKGTCETMWVILTLIKGAPWVHCHIAYLAEISEDYTVFHRCSDVTLQREGNLLSGNEPYR